MTRNQRRAINKKAPALLEKTRRGVSDIQASAEAVIRDCAACTPDDLAIWQSGARPKIARWRSKMRDMRRVITLFRAHDLYSELIGEIEHADKAIDRVEANCLPPR